MELRDLDDPFFYGIIYVLVKFRRKLTLKLLLRGYYAKI